jgi:membrane protein DedA with SNARE-associated domain
MVGPATLIINYGSLAVAGVVCLESMGLPLPGEAILIAAAIDSCPNKAGKHISLWVPLVPHNGYRTIWCPQGSGACRTCTQL